MKKLLVTFFAVVALSLKIFAIPACPDLVYFTQPNGVEVTYYIKGDEKIHWNESPAGYTLMWNNERYLVFAQKNKNGNLNTSNIIYCGDDLSKYSISEQNAIAKIDKNLGYSKEQVNLMKQIWEIPETVRAGESDRIDAVIGEKHTLVILAEFTNKTFTHTAAEFEALMNQDNYTLGGNKGSVRDFYRINSYGKVDFHVTVIGPVSCPNTTAYYAQNTSAWARSVAQLADPLVDYSIFAGSTLFVPSFHIIFAGYGDESIDNGQQIWSHKSQFTYLPADGVYLGARYSCSPELSGNAGTNLTKIGVICHELCHTFGAPDYYDTDYGNSGGEYPGTGKWDLMADGAWNASGACPANINMWQKILFGWVNPIELTEPTSVTNMPNSNDSAVAYWFQVNTNAERYVLENRQKTGFDLQVPGHGLLIYHIDSNAVNSPCNNSTHPQQVYPVCKNSSTAIPNSSIASYGGTALNSANCPFPGTSNKKYEFSGTSVPCMFSWNETSGMPITDKAIVNISETPSTGDATVVRTVNFNFESLASIIRGDMENKFTIYPNPVTNELHIANYNLQNGIKLEIIDLSGKIISTFYLQPYRYSIDVSQLKNGIYFLRIDSKFIQKFTKE
ncbi:hypothetical protein FACS1894178_7200 [Bacteroidia bacterium]|nr:hypothetical protein FACS1894178_7200 [Bacteroidia bacterium]